MKNKFILLLVIVLLFTITACSKDKKEGNGKQLSIEQVQLDKTDLTISKGDNETFSITVKGAAGTINIKSSNDNIAKVEVVNDDPDSILCNDGYCFFDGLTSDDVLTFTVNGVNSGTAYIDVSLADLQTMSLEELNDSGKIEVTVK